MSATTSALVIGGGIAGPVTATALRMAGIDATVYEAYPAPSEGIGGTLAIAPNGMAALGIVGADEAVRDAALAITGQSMSVAGHSLGRLRGLEGVEPQRMIGRGDLHRVLRDRALEMGVRFEYGKRLVGVDEGEDAVTAHFADASTATGGVLIGADGVRSTVRTLIDPEAPAAGYTGLLGFQGYLDAGDLDVEPGIITFAFGRRAYYLYWRTPDGRLTWGANLPSKRYLSLTEARAVPAETWLRTLRETYAGDVPGEALAAGTRAGSLDITGAIHIMPPVPHWYRGRMVLVGDAVHAPSNSTGQGASLAVESAIELARCLRDLPDPASAFAAYESLRRERVEGITRRGARLNRTKTPGPVGRQVMRVVMPAMMRRMDVEKTMGPELRHRIPWTTPVATSSALTATS
jgi:2-polyprenyl-6-methoxyphenol hydroxylase-like FAD-dependent oxidoreductase